MQLKLEVKPEKKTIRSNIKSTNNAH